MKISDRFPALASRDFTIFWVGQFISLTGTWMQNTTQPFLAYRLTGCRLVVTLEPCVMCAGAAVHARVAEIIYGAADPKGGGVRSLYRIASDDRLNHRPDVVSGVLAEECAGLLTAFFRSRR